MLFCITPICLRIELITSVQQQILIGNHYFQLHFFDVSVFPQSGIYQGNNIFIKIRHLYLGICGKKEEDFFLWTCVYVFVTKNQRIRHVSGHVYVATMKTWTCLCLHGRLRQLYGHVGKMGQGWKSEQAMGQKELTLWQT